MLCAHNLISCPTLVRWLNFKKCTAQPSQKHLPVDDSGALVIAYSFSCMHLVDAPVALPVSDVTQSVPFLFRNSFVEAIVQSPDRSA